MRVCPACNETFADDLKFCDLDGTPLKREPGAAFQPGSNRLWSLLGVALLVGALAISAAMIIFQPRGPAAQSPGPQQLGSATNQRSTTPTASETERPALSTDVAAAGTSAPLDSSSQKPKSLASQLPAGPAPDPKSAALAAGPSDEKPAPAGQADPTANIIPAESARPVKAVAADPVRNKDAATSDAPSAATPSTEPKKEPKARTAKESAQDSSAKGDDKKKGGFLKVFKKIFGKKN
jgi:hypothetical protein